MKIYLIDDRTLRLTVMTKCDYFPNLTLHTEEKQMKELPIILQLFETCPSGWMPKSESALPC